jgi:hypothetical protein
MRPTTGRDADGAGGALAGRYGTGSGGAGESAALPDSVRAALRAMIIDELRALVEG